jgi:hypothetical protein
MAPATVFQIPKPRREVPKWERRDVTVCIAAVTAELDRKIILCTDEKASSALGSSETLKIRPAGNFQCLVSGTDTDIVAVMRLLRRSLAAPEIDETNLLPAVRSALFQKKRKNRRVDRRSAGNVLSGLFAKR